MERTQYIAAVTLKSAAGRFIKAGAEFPTQDLSEETIDRLIRTGRIYPMGGAPLPQTRTELPVGNATNSDAPDVVLGGGRTIEVDTELERLAAEQKAGETVTPGPQEEAAPATETVMEPEAARAAERAEAADVAVDLEEGTVEGDEDDDEDEDESLFA